MRPPAERNIQSNQLTISHEGGLHPAQIVSFPFSFSIDATAHSVVSSSMLDNNNNARPSFHCVWGFSNRLLPYSLQTATANAIEFNLSPTRWWGRRTLFLILLLFFFLNYGTDGIWLQPAGVFCFYPPVFFSVDSDIDYPQKLSGSNTCTTINQRAAGRLLWPPLFMLSLKGQKDKKILETHIYII